METEASRARLRRRIHEILEVARPGDRASQIIDGILIVLVASNVVAVILESVEAFAVAYSAWFGAFELVSVLVFTVEYGLRVWSSVEARAAEGPAWRQRLRSCARPMAIVDLLAILPFYLMMLLPLDLRFLRVLRLLRALKLTRYSGAMATLLAVMRHEAGVFGAAGFLLATLLILASSGIYLVEHHAQPEVFGSIPASMWWAVVTLTTVGYGDVTPITPAGKLFASFVTVIGVVMVALPAGILASGFTVEVRRRQESFRLELDHALADGIISRDEASSLETLRDRLGLSEEDTQQLIDTALSQMTDAPDGCPHCGKSLQEPATR